MGCFIKIQPISTSWMLQLASRVPYKKLMTISLCLIWSMGYKCRIGLIRQTEKCLTVFMVLSGDSFLYTHSCAVARLFFSNRLAAKLIPVGNKLANSSSSLALQPLLIKACLSACRRLGFQWLIYYHSKVVKSYVGGHVGLLRTWTHDE